VRYPDFFVIGVVKGGTTALHHLLAAHPGVHLGPIKETHFFARADMRPDLFLREYALDVRLDVRRYINDGMKRTVHGAHVEDATDYLRLFSAARPGQKLGEVCPSYAISPSAPGAIHHAAPDARIAIMVRDPVARAWSHYMMNLREGKTMERDFLREVMNDASRSPSGWGVNHQYLALGDYAPQIQRYLDLFPADHVHVYVYEHFAADPAATLRDLFRAIGVDPSIAINADERRNEAARPRHAALNHMLVRSGALRALKDLVPPGMRGGFRKLLQTRKAMPRMPMDQALQLWEHYEPGVRRLSEVTGIDFLGIWAPAYRDHA